MAKKHSTQILYETLSEIGCPIPLKTAVLEIAAWLNRGMQSWVFKRANTLGNPSAVSSIWVFVHGRNRFLTIEIAIVDSATFEVSVDIENRTKRVLVFLDTPSFFDAIKSSVVEMMEYIIAIDGVGQHREAKIQRLIKRLKQEDLGSGLFRKYLTPNDGPSAEA